MHSRAQLQLPLLAAMQRRARQVFLAPTWSEKLSRILIDNPIQNDFAMVPNVLWTWPGLSFKAKGFFAYLLSHRHGSIPPVAGMERETGLGRDARRAAMNELIEAGLAHWCIQRDASNRIIEKYLTVTTRPLIAAILADNPHAPENPSHGKPAAEKRHAPEKPSVGKSGPKRSKPVPSRPANPAILQYKEDIEARAEAEAPAPRSASPRSETTRAASEGVLDDPVTKRRLLAASLGLPFCDPATGQWVNPDRPQADEREL